MPNVSLKGLKVIAICITALIVICIAVLLDYSPKHVESVKSENVEAINNREKVIHHSGDIYCYATVPTTTSTQYMLLKLPINFDDNIDRKIIEIYKGSLGNVDLDVYKNKIFYRNGSTYFYDTITGEIDKFCEGELQFMLEPNYFVMLQDGDLYKGRYYENNFVVNHLEVLAEGNFVRVGEDNKRMYYYSVGKTNTIVVALDKETLNIIIYDNIETYKQKLDDVIITDNYLFEVYGNDTKKHIKKISKQADKDGKYLAEELKIDELEVIEFIDAKYTEPLMNNETFDDMYFYGSIIVDPGDYYTDRVLDTKIYKYDSKRNKVSEYAGELNERYAERYSITSGDDGCSLYFDAKKITQIPTSMTEFSDVAKMDVLEINIVEDYLYYEVMISKVSGDSEVILAQMPRSGGTSRRINIPKKD